MKKEEIISVVEEFIAAGAEDLCLIEVKISAANTIEVVVDSLEGVTIDRCIELSRFVESRFDREKEDYELTVASASISEPFRSPFQYRKNVGREIEVWEVDAKTKKCGVLESVGENGFVLAYEEKVAVDGKKRKELQEVKAEIPFDNVREAKLVIKF